MRRLLFVFLVMFTCALVGNRAQACSCFNDQDTEVLRRKADLVFVGKVREITKVDQETVASNNPRVIVDFTLRKSWKGSKYGDVTLHTYLNRFSCGGYKWREGVEYLVFAYKNRAKEWLGSQDNQYGYVMVDPNQLPKPNDDIFDVDTCTATREASDPEANYRHRELGPVAVWFYPRSPY